LESNSVCEAIAAAASCARRIGWLAETTLAGRRRLPRAGGRRAEAHHLEHVAAVGGASHHDLDGHALETNDPIDPLAAEHPGLAAVEAEQREKPDRLVEVLDDKSDVDEVGDAGAMAVHVWAPHLGVPLGDAGTVSDGVP
jgi:hypothetical protein